MENWKYAAFISYRHGGKDEFAAKTLHSMLENYRIPDKLAKKIGKKKVGRIFRDVDELPSSSSLYNNIEEALGQSEYLLVICTPRLQESKWCMQEIELFQKLRGSDHIIAILAEGEPEESFPYAITHRMVNGQEIEAEPLAADIRGENEASQKRKMKIEKLRILAAMLHCEFDQLRQREKQRQIRRGITLGGVGAAVVCVFLAQTVRENLKLQKQVRKTQAAQSYLLAEYSDTAFSGDNPKLAAMLAMEGLPRNLGNDRPFEGAAMASLTNALQVYDYQKGYTARTTVKTQTMDAVMISPYDDYIAYIDLVSSTDYTLHFYDINTGKNVADFPVDPDYASHQSCNSKIAFFGDHRCAIAGAEGIQVIDMNTMKILWQGVHGMSVSASVDGSTVSVFDSETHTLTFYDADGTLISERTWDCYDSIYYGMSDDGKYAAFTGLADEEESSGSLYILDVSTGNVIKQIDDAKYSACVANGSSWFGHNLFFTYGSYNYGHLNMDEDKIYEAKIINNTDLYYVDTKKETLYYRDGLELICASMNTGEQIQTYKASGDIADVVYTGDGERTTFAICDADGTIEYVDYTEEPYRIGSLAGDGTGCSKICAGDTYAATYLLNSYEFRIYQLNEREASKTGTMKKQSNESIDHLLRRDGLLAVNGSRNSYMVDLSTLKGAEFDIMVSYMGVIDNSLVSCDNLDGTISIYDSQSGELIVDLPDKVEANMEYNGAFAVEDGVLQEYSYEKSDKSAEELEPVYTEEVPADCTNAYITPDGYLIEYLQGEESDSICILNKERKEVLSQKITDFRGEADLNYIIYQPAGETEYVLYDFVREKEIFRGDLGEFSWMEGAGDYAFLCSSDKGAIVVDLNTGEKVLSISQADTLYDFAAPKGQPYFTALYLADNGDTRLDVYSKEDPSSPIAKIKGGLGMNEEGEVVIYDGMQTLNAVPFLSIEEMYAQGVEFLDGQSLTEEQKAAYHCD